MHRSGGIYLALALVVLVASILSPAFSQPSNIFNILRQASALGIVSIGQTMVIIAGAMLVMAEITRGSG